MKNRTKFDVVLVILTMCKTPIRKTRLMYSANLSYEATCDYLREIRNRHLIEKQKGFYVLTAYGVEFLEGLTLLLDLWYEREIPRV